MARWQYFHIANCSYLNWWEGGGGGGGMGMEVTKVVTMIFLHSRKLNCSYKQIIRIFIIAPS